MFSRRVIAIRATATGRLTLFLQFSDFGVQWGFGALTMVPDMLEGQSRALKTQMIVYFQQSFEPRNGSLMWRPGSVKVGQNFKNTPTL